MPKVLKGDFGMPWGSMSCGDSRELRIAEASFVNRKPRVLKHATIAFTLNSIVQALFSWKFHPLRWRHPLLLLSANSPICSA